MFMLFCYVNFQIPFTRIFVFNAGQARQSRKHFSVSLIFYLTRLRRARYCQGKLSVRLSVCNVEVSWSYRLELLENNFTAD